MVWINGLEPSTPCMSSRYSNQLSYTHNLEADFRDSFYIIQHDFPFVNTFLKKSAFLYAPSAQVWNPQLSVPPTVSSSQVADSS